MKALWSVFFIAVCTQLFAQYNDTSVCIRKGKIHFFSSSPLEDIEATATNASFALFGSTKRISAKVQQTSFVFKDKLMQEHFNENYMESDKFPLAVLDMTIVENVDFTKNGIYDVTLKGTLEIHGVKNEREIKGKLTVANGAPAQASAVFDVKLADHGIKIPKAVVMNIAESIKVDVDFVLEKYVKK